MCPGFSPDTTVLQTSSYGQRLIIAGITLDKSVDAAHLDTRLAEGTKMVFTGDIMQIDQPYLDRWSNGVTHLSEKMLGQPIFQHVNLRKGERSELSEIASKLL